MAFEKLIKYLSEYDAPDLHPNYCLQIMLMTPILLFLGSYIAIKLDSIFDQNVEQESTAELMLEISLQTGLTGFFAYFLREIVRSIFSAFMPRTAKNKLGMHKKPDKYAVIIMGSVMFFMQPNLREKIVYLYHNQKTFPAKVSNNNNNNNN